MQRYISRPSKHPEPSSFHTKHTARKLVDATMGSTVKNAASHTGIILGYQHCLCVSLGRLPKDKQRNVLPDIK